LKLVNCQCGECDEMIPAINKMGRPARYKHGHNPSKYREKGKNSPMWKGGRCLDREGYIRVYSPNHPQCNSRGYVREHRLVYEKYNKCCLLPNTEIHHKNNVRTDNRIGNLVALTKSEHRKIHYKLEKYQFVKK
jgi:hypothetical protein